MNNIKLRDCPCCGHKAEICKFTDFISGDVTVYIQCTNCILRTKEVLISIDISDRWPSYDPIKILVKSWNQRVKENENE